MERLPPVPEIAGAPPKIPPAPAPDTEPEILKIRIFIMNDVTDGYITVRLSLKDSFWTLLTVLALPLCF